MHCVNCHLLVKIQFTKRSMSVHGRAQKRTSTNVLLCRFSAGDVVSVRPRNTAEDVHEFCQLLRLDPEARFILRATGSTAGKCNHLGRCCAFMSECCQDTGQGEKFIYLKTSRVVTMVLLLL